MRRAALLPAFLFLLCAGLAFPRQNPKTESSRGLELLTRVARHYANASSYRIEVTEERTIDSAYLRQWTRKEMIAAEAPGGRFHFEGRSGFGSAIKVSDGKTVWKYRADRLRYTARQVSTSDGGKPEPIAMSETAASDAGRLREDLAKLADSLKSAALLPDATVRIDGVPVACEVVRVASSDEMRIRPYYPFVRTIWIDKKHETIVKIVEHAQVTAINGPREPEQQDTTTVYSKTVLEGPLPDSEFIFDPPRNAHRIANFPDPMDDGFGNSLAGDPVPPLKLRAADGTETPIESFRGKPMILDFWATWCAPCVAAMPRLAGIYNEGKDKGLLLVSVDRDEDASKATDFLARKGYNWPNFHDGDGEIEKLMGSGAIPRTLIVDAQGAVVYDGSGMDENRLRTHLAQLGPQFADLAPKPPKPAPCVATK